MSKRLMVLVLVASVVCFFSAAYAEVQNVKVGGDITVVGVSRDNVNQARTSAHNGLGVTAAASIARIKVEANLTDNVDVNFRLLNERVWGTLDGTAAPFSPTVDIDQAYVTLKDFLKDQIGFPLTLKIGRQDIKCGAGLLVADADTNQRATSGNFAGTAIGDLSANRAFDAVCAVADFSPFTLTAGAVKGLEGAALTNNQDDLNLFLLNGMYKMDAMNTMVELTYLVEPRDKDFYTTTGEITVYDGRMTTTPVENLNLEGEFAYQTYKDTAVRNEKKTISDTAIRLAATLGLPDVAMSPSIGLDYTRLSKTWLPLFEDLTPADIMNLVFANTNAQVLGVSVSAKPSQDVALKLRYAVARAMEQFNNGTLAYTSLGTGQTYTMTTKKSMGQEVDLGATYDYTDDVQFGLNLGYFMPGKAFDRASRASQSQMIGSMKVSF